MFHAELVVHSNLWRTVGHLGGNPPTLTDEGHPRGNGDGPLTTSRSIETQGG